ncbi:RNA polymerase sigma factor SigM [Lapillicoccus jejuensis]|uniref:RNA polymerase ECF family sigma subunit n=1 Tax=Lapillicoccus jejuensis TaxID=402171 RepID=A0A542DZ46_9MICO|nr:RNA polymerase sigma factor SigM [Lapillicoccus jejuensis]TQJ08365.1 RNA polymerase ECF family sigma subunit [Lapillicoccus jejuensis]
MSHPGGAGEGAGDPDRPALDLATADDATLLAAHVQGDPDAFGEIFRRHKDRLWAVALRTCGDRELASDCLQDAFVAAFRRAGTFRGDAAVTTWLHRIVVNACLDRLRRRRPTSPLPDTELPDRHDDHRSTEVALDVREALARLPEGQRIALVLVDMQGLSVADAAAVLEVAEGTVKSRCARGRAQMAELLGLVRTADGRLVDRTDDPPGP